MMAFELFVFVCLSATECQWQMVDIYYDQIECQVAGSKLVTDDDHVLKWKCKSRLRNSGD